MAFIIKKIGTYIYQFNNPGTYYYWSGFVNNQQISFRGVINVVYAVDEFFDIDVTVNGFYGNF